MSAGTEAGRLRIRDVRAALRRSGARMMLMLEAAGFSIRFTPIYWTFASGFPKALNIGKAVDARQGRARTVVGRNPNSRERATVDSSLYKPGTVGKTAQITRGDHPLVRLLWRVSAEARCRSGHRCDEADCTKRLSSRKHWKTPRGITWLDDCRIPASNNTNPQARKALSGREPSGRFPANVLVSDEVLGAHSAFLLSRRAVAMKTLPFLVVPEGDANARKTPAPWTASGSIAVRGCHCVPLAASARALTATAARPTA